MSVSSPPTVCVAGRWPGWQLPSSQAARIGCGKAGCPPRGRRFQEASNAQKLKSLDDSNAIRTITADEAAAVGGGRAMVEKPPKPQPDNGSSWGSVSELPANDGIGTVFRF